MIGQTLKAACPEFSKSYLTNELIGTTQYAMESSICLAANHAGLLQKEEGEVEFTMFAGIQKYEGSSAFSIESKSASGKIDAFSFVFKPS